MPIHSPCQFLLTDMTVFDSSGIEATLQELFAAIPCSTQKPFWTVLLSIPFAFTSSFFPAIPLARMPMATVSISKRHIPVNFRAGLENANYSINQDGIPYCPNDASLPLKPEGTSKLRSGVTRYKFSCPNVRWEKDPLTGKYHRVCHCENPCTSSPSRRMVYIYPEKDLRAYPGTLRRTAEWSNAYKVRTTVERSINHFKDSFFLAGCKKNLHADLILAGITQLISVILAD